MPERKKLFLFSHVSNVRNITGAEKLLLFVARKLSADFDCTLIAPQEGRLTSLARRSGIGVLIWDIPLLYGMCSPYEGLYRDAEGLMGGSAAAQLTGLLAANRPDVVFVNTCVNIVPPFAAKRLGIPVVWHITEVVPDNGYAGEAVRLVDLYSDRIVGISEAALNPFRREVAADKLSQLFPSWESGEFKPPGKWPQLRLGKRREWGIRPEETVVGYISSFLIREKGAEHFIQAALGLKEAFPHARFVVIGGEADSAFHRSLRKLAGQAGSGRIVFVDHEDRIEAAYSAMDIAVIPSLINEGFGMTAMEAMIFGKPVVAYASGGLQEILQATGNGDYLVTSGDITGLSAKISGLLASPGTISAIGQENRIRVEEAFGPAAYMGRFHELLEHLHRLTSAPGDTPADEAGAAAEPAPSAHDAPRLASGARRRARSAKAKRRLRPAGAKKRTGVSRSAGKRRRRPAARKHRRRPARSSAGSIRSRKPGRQRRRSAPVRRHP
ncbi:glycosyltransferase family 1 protein [Paenibacillus oralis]|uniref:Glycosyltransferase family 1 protein n=1 Tax=Paenibacillus oralis TaxID=2490856 RepID=A0A3P3TU31_9BACL|nr:glycosyltransferase family 4 protein [Paenibacillus oralis]RRJ61632.1 glycosyltransferase family 1 protein [Paenibacillus oralis]